MKTFLLKSHFLTIVFLAANLFFASVAFGQATVTTDKDDYGPGEYVIITGTGWTPGETVTLHFDETPKPATCLLPHDMTTVADSSGNIYNNQFLIKINHIGVAFLLTATGQTSGLIATRNFTDGQLSELTIGAQSIIPTSGNVTQVNYASSIKIVANNNNTAIITLNVTGLPTGVLFSPQSISINGNNTAQFTLTLTTGINTPVILSPGQTFNVTASTPHVNGVTSDTESGRLIVSSAQCTQPSAPTISSPVIYCLGTTPTVLTATGSNLLWYSDAIGGIGSSIAPTPSTNSSGNTSYYVSQTIGCESPRAKIDVTVNALPVAPNAGNYSGAYDGLPHVGSAIAGAGETIDWYTTLSGGNPTSAPSGTNVGVYSAYAEARNITTGCVSATRTLVSVTITKKAASVSPIANTKVYGSPEPILTGTLVGFLEADAVTASYSRTAGETVLGGPYTISAVLSPTGVLSNYDITYNTASFTITTKAASVSPIANTKVYGSPEPVLTGTLVGFLEADAVAASYSRTAGETVLGTYSISAVLSPTGVLSNYDITYNTASFTITTKAASVSPIANTKVYGSPEPVLMGTLVGFLEADAVAASYSRTAGETVIAGPYTISAVLSPTGVLSNYDITYNTALFTITTKVASVSPIANTKVYGSPEPILTGTLVGFLEADAVTASYSRTAGETVIGGPYTISAVLNPTGVLSNYNITYNTAAFTITTKVASVSPIANTKVYGSPEPILTGTLVGFLEADAVTASYSRTAGETVIGGPYTISAVLSLTGVLSNYDITYNTALFTITTKVASVFSIANTKVYGSPEPILTGTLVGFLEADAVTASYSRTAGETVLGGPYTISAVLSLTGVLSNYDITYNTALFTITTKVASVFSIANTKVYGSPEPILTGTLVGFLEADAVTASYSRTAGETVLGGPYTISAVLNPTGVLSNYNITYNTAAFTITTKVASVSPIANTKVYGSPEPILTGTLVGFLEADAVTASYSRTAGETVLGGPYTISAVLSPTGVLSNYYITYNTAAFTITTKGASVSPIANTKVYGSPEPVLTGTLVGFLEADAVAASYSRTAGETVIGGPYTISAVLNPTGVLSNYDITYNTALFTITTKAASVSPIANTKVYGSPEPLLTGTLVGFLEADAVTASYSRTAGETVLGGPYTISAVLNPTGVLSNYDITYNTALFTITTKAASVSPIANTKVYGSPEPILTGTLVGFLEADAVTASYSRTAGETVLGGPYTISAVLNPTGVLSNYDITYNTALFTITTKTASVSPIANTKVYGSPEPLLTGTLVGFLEADAVAASYSRTSGETVIEGPYTISAVLNSTGVLSNYDITYNTALFTITTKTASVSPIANTKVYGSPEPVLTGTLVGFLEADAVAASYSRTAGETVIEGPYTISAVLNPTGVLSNYDITYNTAAFTITTKTASVSPIANTKVYGSPEPLLTGTLVGFLEADAVTASYSRTAGETVLGGPYTISAVLNPTGVLSNYDITYNTALFTITTKVASVSPIANTKVYGSPEPLLTGTLVGFLEADAVTASYSRTAGETVLGGPYTISAVLNPTGVLSNYDITYNTAAFTITTKAASVSPIANTKVYGSPEPVLTGTLVGFLEADAVAASYSRTSGETVLGGPYTISAVLNPTGVLSNYNITYNTALFTISKKTASVTPYVSSKYCGQNDPLLFTGNLAGFIGNDNVTALYNRTAGEIAGGVYTISALLSPSNVLTNYNIDYNTALFTINSVLIDASASSAPIALGSSATLSATVTSAVSGNLSGIPVLFTIDNGNGVITSYASQTNSSGLATFSVSNLSVEVYKIKAAAGSGCANATAYLAVYDPNGGFVTGGGWIMSPLGAYTANPTLTGKANFGFNAKYKKGNTQVDGNTEFQFQTGNLNFSSSSHEAMSLVIAGAQAIYKGQGTINGVPGYSFMVSAIDGEKKSAGVTDKFRIKIWNGAGVVYDNQTGAADNADATTAIGGGSIVIHEVKKNGAAKVVIVEKTPEIVPFAITAYPNPSAQYFIIDIKGGTSEKTEVIVYDILGRMVKHIQNSDSKEIKFGEELSSGSYIAIINQGTQQKTVRLIKQ